LLAILGIAEKRPQGVILDNATGELTTDTAVDAFAALLDPSSVPQDTEESRLEKLAAEESDKDKPEPEQEAEEAEDDVPDIEALKVPVKINGKIVEVSVAELKSEYGKEKASQERFEQAAEMRKTADAEMQKAHAERTTYAQNLQRMAVQLEGALQEQQKTDWNTLLESDPIEYLKQQNLFQQRQAAYQQNMTEQQKMAAVFQAEQQKAYVNTLKEQQEALLAKLPAWKDPAKAQAEKAALKTYLLAEGYDESAVDGISDAKAVVLARKAMLYDQMIEKARAATKKVSTLPQKVERPGNGQQQLDKRSVAFQKLSKSGSVDDAAAVFRNFV
jgi:hypothetical protein